MQIETEHPQFNDWRWQMRHMIRDFDSLRELFSEVKFSEESEAAMRSFPLRVTPYYASLVKQPVVTDPVFAQFMPQGVELDDPEWLVSDPLNEVAQSPVHGLVQRYPDRALLLATSQCATLCRHCTRKRVSGGGEGASPLVGEQLKACTDYLARHPRITDVLISGGDPLTLPIRTLREIVGAVRSVPSVEIIRIASRVPVTLPMRIDAEVCDMLAEYAPVYLNTHFNHAAEISPQAGRALALLANAGIPLGNQTVLLRGVNDRPEIIEELCRALLRHRVKPYYLFQCDLVRGIEHFRTPLQTGLDIMSYLRGRLSGLGIPHFCVDTPHAGKIELLPNAILERREDCYVLLDSNGEPFRYPEIAK